jgi:electron transport complex protein RnfD
MDTKLKLAKPPFLRSDDSIRKIMGDVLIALIPAEIAAVIFFGWYALFLMVSGALIAELTEFFIMRVLRRRKSFLPDGSAAITGILLAMNVPSNLPFWALIIGVIFAIAIVKHAFGGLGYNIFNPALMGRIFLFISFPALMTTWPKVHAFAFFTNPVDVVTAATPLNLAKYSHQMTSYWSLFIGKKTYGSHA